MQTTQDSNSQATAADDQQRLATHSSALSSCAQTAYEDANSDSFEDCASSCSDLQRLCSAQSTGSSVDEQSSTCEDATTPPKQQQWPKRFSLAAVLELGARSNEPFNAARRGSSPMSGPEIKAKKSKLRRKNKKASKCSAVNAYDGLDLRVDHSDLVAALRLEFFDFLNEDESRRGRFLADDISRVTSDDWYLQRFLLRENLDVGRALRLLKSSLYFKSESFLTLGHNIFPHEMYKGGFMFVYERDRRNNVTVHVRGKAIRRHPECIALEQAFFLKVMLQADKESDGKGIALILDGTDAGLLNADYQMLLTVIRFVQIGYPIGFSYALVHNMPYILKPLWQVIRPLIADQFKDAVKFSTNETILEYIDEKNLPDFLGGTCARDYTQIPDDSVSFYQVSKLLGLTKNHSIAILDRLQFEVPREMYENSRRQLEELPD